MPSAFLAHRPVRWPAVGVTAGPRSARALRSVVAMLGAMLALAAPAGATNYFWTNAAGGAATVTTNWSPLGYPHALDIAQFNLSANYTTTWASPADTFATLYIQSGNPIFSIANHLGVASAVSIFSSTSLTLSSGTMWTTNVSATGLAAGSLVVDGYLSELDATHVTLESSGRTPQLDVADGGRLLVRGPINLGYSTGSHFAGSIHHRVRAGLPSKFYYPVIYTLAGGAPNPDCTIGGVGSATLDAYDGGYLNTAGVLMVGAYTGGSGTLHCYPNGGLASGVTSNGETFIGANNVGPAAGGVGTVQLEGSYSYFNGRCWLGDADEVPGGPGWGVLRTDDGAYTVFSGGIATNNALTGELDLIGGTTHVIGGTVTLRQAAPFLVGSAIGHAPVLWLENGTTTDLWPASPDQPALGVGRGGPGTVIVAGAGSALTVHGGLALGDSTGGNGYLLADSSATLNVQGPVVLGGGGAATLAVHGVTVTLPDTVVMSPAKGIYSTLDADSFATLHVVKPLVLAGAGSAVIYVHRGAHMDVPGLTLGSGFNGIDVGSDNATATIGDHLDITGNCAAIVDTAGVLVYTNAARAVTVGAGNAQLIINNGGRAQLAAELDVRGQLVMEPSNTVGLMSGAPAMLAAHAAGSARAAPAARAAQFPPGFVVGGTLKCPLTRILDAGRAVGLGLIDGRFHIDSGAARLTISYDDLYFTGRLVAGDSTKSDGFVSIGQTYVGLDTLEVLDSDGGDLGKVVMTGGLLDLPKPGHLKSGFVLQGNGTVDGSLDVRDSAWVSLQGTITGDVALAGSLDLGENTGTLAMGSLHPTATGRVGVKIGDAGQDLVAVVGTAVLGGTLDVRTIGGHLPGVGSLFTVMTAGSVSGTFATVTINGRPSAGVITVIYGATNVRVAVVGTITGVGDGDPGRAAAPAELRFAALGGPRETALGLDLPAAAHVRVTLYDVGGRQVAELADGELEPGRHRFELGRAAPGSGMYFARAEVRSEAGVRVLSTRAVVLR